MVVVLGDVRIGGIIDEFVAGIYIWAANDNDVVQTAGDTSAIHARSLHRPRGAASGVARSLVRHESHTAQRHLVAILENAIDFRRWVRRFLQLAVLEVLLAAG